MKVLRWCAMALFVLMCFYLVGCCGGGTEKVIEKETVVVPKAAKVPTLGKELEDLNQAYKKGAITKEEFEQGKRRLLERYKH